ncbi:MAG: excinuclease ABC subunit UvrC [Planctomycetota bacterium]
MRTETEEPNARTRGFLLAGKLQRLPRTPGVYIFKDEGGNVLYVGKAKDLRSRVRSYFVTSTDRRLAVQFIERHVADLEIVQTRNEKEALLLENNLIKKLQPRYNIRLRDDKSFLHLKIDRAHPYPAIVPVRRPRADGAQYFGPYASAGAIRGTLRLVRSFIPLRDCSDREFARRTRPCLKHQIKLCAAPCVERIGREDYARLLDEAVSILQGRTTDVLERLRAEMAAASVALDFERAAILRDQIRFLETSTAGQKVEAAERFDLDALGLYREGDLLEIVVLFFRDGKLVAASPHSFDSDLPSDEALSSFLWQFYGRGGRAIPGEILVPGPVYGTELVACALAERRGARVLIHHPRRGEKVRHLQLAAENARLSHKMSAARMEANARVLERLKDWLQLGRVPADIECCDISCTSGAQAVGSIVRFRRGEPWRSGFRRYRVKTAAGADDYAMLGEVLRRRLHRGKELADLPDLLIVDGGRGHLNVALRLLRELSIEGLSVAGLAKAPRRGGGLTLRPGEEERLFLPHVREPLRLPPETEECHLLQRVRDEAHRFALEYHRKRRGRASLASILSGIRGLGPAKATRVLATFGGLRGLSAASTEELAKVPGIGSKLAAAIYEKLHG